MQTGDGQGPVMCVVGTRPEVIKMFPVVHALRAQGLDAVLVNTGQHRGLCTDALGSFGLDADVDLQVMAHDQTPTDVAAKVLTRLRPELERHRPSWVVVQGDTTTVLAAAIAGAYQGIPVAHVEAGLRSHDLSEPFPEELNRRAVGAITSLHFPPTGRAAAALRAEGVPEEKILLTGNTVIDALRWATEHLPPAPTDPVLARLDPSRPMLLLTTHRRENFGSRLDDVFAAVRTLTEQRPELQVLFPVHPNPSVRRVADGALGDVDAVLMSEPLDYLDMARALQRCTAVLTDSGGLQEEAPALGKRVLVLREVTERPEAIDCGIAELLGTDPGRIVDRVGHALDHPMADVVSPYGDGRAGERIALALQGKPVDAFEWSAEETG
ncbi:MAG: UDP-N-acetylglucosamine 2-epimerase (non-hydrolyzing) [Actinomycetota bacterium]